MKLTHAAQRRRQNRSPQRKALTGLALIPLLAAAVALSGCTAKDSLAQQAQAGDDKNYIAGDGSVTEYAPGQRGDAVEFSGTDFDGNKVSAQSLRGHVTVLNFWYAACAPCRAEAPGLQKLSQQFAGDGVKFYGVNVRDAKATADAFDRSFNITYPSFNDKDGSVLLGMSKFVPPAAVPTTVVLDKDGKVAARVLGLADQSTLKSLIDGALGKSDASGSPSPAAAPPLLLGGNRALLGVQ